MHNAKLRSQINSSRATVYSERAEETNCSDFSEITGGTEHGINGILMESVVEGTGPVIKHINEDNVTKTADKQNATGVPGNCLWNRVHSNEESDDSFIEDDCDSDRPNSSPKNLRTLLFHWAVTHQITHSAITQLLRILCLFHTPIPKDARTLLSTFNVDGINNIAGGEYYHFGVQKQIEHQFKMGANVEVDSIIKLQLNVDGLPFRSMETNVESDEQVL